MAYRVLTHTADTGIEARADSLAGLIEELARGMFELMATTEPSSNERSVEVSVEAETNEDLVVDVLSELLYTAEVEGVHLYGFRAVTDDSGRQVRVEAAGIPDGEITVGGAPIKAVTYHDLVVEEQPSGWYGRVYFDV